MLFFECIAIILRRNIRRIDRWRGQNRLSGGFMTPAWPSPGPARTPGSQTVTTSVVNAPTRRPLFRPDGHAPESVARTVDACSCSESPRDFERARPDSAHAPGRNFRYGTRGAAFGVPRGSARADGDGDRVL